MKKMEWLVVILIMAMGMTCLIISATSFREVPFFQIGSSSIGEICISMIAVSGIIALIYFFIKSGKH